MELRGRLPVLALAVALSLLAGSATRPIVARAEVLMTRDEALGQAFPGARIERKTFALTVAEAAAVERHAHAKAGSRLVNAYLAWHGDTLAGTAFLDTRIVRTMPGVFMISVGPDTTVQRVDVLAFHEPSDYRPTTRWLGQFARRRLDRLQPGGDLRMLAGATLTTRAVTESTRLALALYADVVAPSLATAAGPRGGR